MTSRGRVVAASVLAVVAIAAWAGFASYVGRLVEMRIEAFGSTPPGGTSVRLANLEHRRGLLVSEGLADIFLDDPCGHAGGDGRMAGAKLAYRVSHLPRPGALMRLEWSLATAPSEAAASAARPAGPITLAGAGTVSLQGEFRTSIELPETTLQSAGQLIRLSASSGWLRIAGPVFEFDWRTSRVDLGDQAGLTELHDLGVQMNIYNRHLGTGTFTLGLGRLVGRAGYAEGLGLSAEVVERGQLVDMRLNPSLQRLRLGERTSRDLKLALALEGLDRASLLTIGRLAGDSCGLRSLASSDVDAQVRGALRTLIKSGFRFGVTRVSGLLDDGALDGRFGVEIRPSDPATPVALVKVLHSSGELLFRGDALDEMQKRALVELGLATPAPGGVRAAFRYVDGVLLVNERADYAAVGQLFIAQADALVNAMLDPPRPMPVLGAQLARAQ